MKRADRFPAAPDRLQLGVGLDLSFGAARGWRYDVARGDRLADETRAFLDRHASCFGHLFVSWQPRDRGALRGEDYFAMFDDLYLPLGKRYPTRALHHTALNLCALEPYDRTELLAFTNALIDRYGFSWVNEDLGVWSLHGHSLPYPLPPYLTERGLRAAITATRDVSRALHAPLVIEFPGFSEGTSVVVGGRHAYDFFREVADGADVPVALDTGHLLSYQWLRGRRGEALLDELDRLPLDRCFEIHLSGCEIRDGQFLDLHHGVLLDEQLELLERLLPRCSRLRAVTYEDPVFSGDGRLIPEARDGFERLVSIVASKSGGAR